MSWRDKVLDALADSMLDLSSAIRQENERLEAERDALRDDVNCLKQELEGTWTDRDALRAAIEPTEETLNDLDSRLLYAQASADDWTRDDEWSKKVLRAVLVAIAERAKVKP